MTERLVREKIIESISVHIDPETLAEPGSCLLCGGVMDKVPLEYEFQDNPPSVVVRNSEPVPGYCCRACEAEYYDGSTSLSLFRETLPKLGSASKLKTALEHRIASLAEALASQSLNRIRFRHHV